jgi:hypothetical protein
MDHGGNLILGHVSDAGLGLYDFQGLLMNKFLEKECFGKQAR